MGYWYVLTPAGAAERVVLAARLLELKRLEFRALEREIEELEKRVKVSDNYAQYPEQFVRSAPTVSMPPAFVAINPVPEDLVG